MKLMSAIREKVPACLGGQNHTSPEQARAQKMPSVSCLAFVKAQP